MGGVPPTKIHVSIGIRRPTEVPTPALAKCLSTLYVGMDPPDESDGKGIDDVYHDRNLLAIGFATAVALTKGPRAAGWYWHDGWPVVWVETPAGQKTWHVTPDLDDVLARSALSEKEPFDGYDGHDRTLKNSRLARYITRTSI